MITLGHAMTHWYPATFFVLLPLIGKELGLSYSQIGLVMTCQYVAGAVSNVPGGMLADTIGRKGLLMALSLFWIGFPYLLIGFTHSYPALLLCVSLVGIGNNLWHPTAIPTLAQRYPERKGLVLSLHGMGGNAGDALAPLAVGALLVTFSWREIVVMNAAPGALMACAILAGMGSLRLAGKRRTQGGAHPVQPDADRQSMQEYAQGFKGLLKNRLLILLAASSAFRSMTQATLLTFLPVFLAYEMGYSPLWVGACMFLLQAAGFLASPLAGHLSDRMGRKRIIMSSMALSGLMMAGMAFAGRSPAFIFLIALVGFFLYAIRPVLQAWLLDATPKKMGGTSIGILFGMQAVGSSIGPVVGGVLADRYGIMTTFWFLAGVIVVANLFVFLIPASNAGAAPSGARAS
ncbi:MFS transporter [Massilia niastensis]|uniref:MFS transporter n=1 Tax=Massilia niastensis TaxID=544911 RepID=UPI00036E8A7E|nr:MFS transporter [Massilia niastensis]